MVERRRVASVSDTVLTTSGPHCFAGELLYGHFLCFPCRYRLIATSQLAASRIAKSIAEVTARFRGALFCHEQRSIGFSSFTSFRQYPLSRCHSVKARLISIIGLRTDGRRHVLLSCSRSVTLTNNWIQATIEMGSFTWSMKRPAALQPSWTSYEEVNWF